MGLILSPNALLEPTYVSNQLLFLKYSPIFLDFDLAPFWAYCLFWSFWAIFSALGVIFWLGDRFKTFFLSTKGIYYFWLGENSSIFFYIIWPHFRPFFTLFWSFGAILGVGVRIKNQYYKNYYCLIVIDESTIFMPAEQH